MASHVNLDALIPREDFEFKSEGTDAPVRPGIPITDLEKTAFFYDALRKPDFQRETAEWDPKRVVGLIRTFIEGDLIPGVILWKNKELLFVIDGSHRLSALIAWVQDDYGDGEKSQVFFNHLIPEEQIKVARKTRELVEREFGSYRTHKDAIANPDKYGPDIVARARRFGSLALELQWVKGDFVKAENSFVRINQQAAQLVPQELELIKSRKKPNAIAARAIIRRGTGHKYWERFGEREQREIESIAREVHELLFHPPLRYPIKSLDMPAGGSVYAAPALRMVFDFIRLCVGAVSQDDDPHGHRTIEYLTRCRRVMRLILSSDKSSLGLHPAVYFYSWTGKQQPILFLAVAGLVIELDRKKQLDKFTRGRAALESFLMSNRALLNQVVRKFGTKSSGDAHVGAYYRDVLTLLSDGTPVEEITTELKKLARYSYLQPDEEPYGGNATRGFSQPVKSGVTMRELLEHAPHCAICQGIVPSQSLSIDHRHRLDDGGPSIASNAQVTHPYCNTGHKEAEVARQSRTEARV